MKQQRHIRRYRSHIRLVNPDVRRNHKRKNSKQYLLARLYDVFESKGEYPVHVINGVEKEIELGHIKREEQIEPLLKRYSKYETELLIPTE